MTIKDERNYHLLAVICELLQKQGYSVSGSKGTVSNPTGQVLYQVDLEIKFKLQYNDDVFRNLPKGFFQYRHTLGYHLEVSTKADAENALKLAMRRLHRWIQQNEGWSAVYLLSGML